MNTKRIRIKDVAAEAGVSVTTVSYILSNASSYSFSAETVRNVHDAARKLGYVPSMAARALASNRSMMIGVVIPQTEMHKELMFSNPFYGEFISSVEYTARQNGYHILISGTNADQNYIEVARTRSLDGIIILGMYMEEHCEELRQAGIPVVLVDCYADGGVFPSVQIDDCSGGYMATKYLLDKGHRRIAHVTGRLMGQGVNQQRMWGWRRALEESGLEYDGGLLLDGEVSYEYGVEAGRRIAESIAAGGASITANALSGVTAVFVSADIVALGLYKGIRESGVSIPEDVSVISFDDTWLAGVCDPGLTVVRQDVSLKGKSAVDTVLELIRHGKTDKQEITLPIGIVERGSVCGR